MFQIECVEVHDRCEARQFCADVLHGSHDVVELLIIGVFARACITLRSITLLLDILSTVAYYSIESANVDWSLLRLRILIFHYGYSF